MAGGAVVQIVAVGQQDAYLTQGAVITFFKSVYRRYTQFAIESIELNFSGQATFGNKTNCTISRSGDLVWKMYLKVDLPELPAQTAWIPEIGHALIDNTSILVGNSSIDKHYGEFLTVWNELTLPSGKADGYKVLIGDTDALTVPDAAVVPATTVYVPFIFWFNRNSGMALPLIALAFHEVKLEVQFSQFKDLVHNTGAPTPGTALTDLLAAPRQIVNSSVYADYIFLDVEERTNFAQNPHEYLIDQLQFTGSENVTQTNIKTRLSFNHPTKSLYWTLRKVGDKLMSLTPEDTGVPTGVNSVVSGNLHLNGNDRFSVRDATTFNIIQPLQHHTNIGRPGIYMYSFALKPEDSQPTGSLNFSRIDNSTLNLTVSAAATAGNGSILNVYAWSLNMFRVVSGMGGIAYNS